MKVRGEAGARAEPARSAEGPAAPLRAVAALLYEGANALDVFGALEPFSRANEFGALPGQPLWGLEQGPPNGAYRLSMLSRGGGLVRMSSGTRLLTDQSLAPDPHAAIDTLVVPGGAGMVAWSREEGALRWVRAHCLAARRVCALGGGVFLLAAAGLLAGRRAATRWDVSAALEREYPATSVAHEPAFVRDGAIWTAAGGAAAVDVALALVEEDFGRAVAMRIARQMVVVARRSAGHPQLTAVLRAQSSENDIFDRLHAWIVNNLGGDLRVEQLASHVGMSTRNFVRRYAEATGVSPAKMVENLRIEAARLAIEAGDVRLDSIAHRFGFSSEDAFRRVFVRQTGLSPRAYRDAHHSATCAA